MNCLDNLIEGYIIHVLCSHLHDLSQHTGIINQTGHLSLRTAISKFQVIQHCVILLCKTLICVLYRTYVSTHLVSII